MFKISNQSPSTTRQPIANSDIVILLGGTVEERKRPCFRVKLFLSVCLSVSLSVGYERILTMKFFWMGGVAQGPSEYD